MLTGNSDNRKRMRWYVCAIASIAAQLAWAMPTKDEIKRVEPLMNELMSAYVKGYTANRKPAAEVGDAAFGFVKDAQTEAAKYVLLKGAIHYYSLARNFDRAADALEALCAQISDVPPDEVESIASKALARAGNARALRLRNIQRVASEQAKAMIDISACKRELRKNPGDATALRGLAKAYVRFGDWPRALKVFSKLGIEAAIYECNPEDAKEYNALKAADYWWGCSKKNPAPYRAHAAELYRRAINEGLVTGLMKTVVENRIAEAEAANAGMNAVVQIPHSTVTVNNGVIPNVSSSGKRYCIIDLSPGPDAQRYAVSWRDSEPLAGRWPDEYKTTKLVLRRIEPGTFIMGVNQKDESHRVTFTKPFYIGVFEVTQRQYQLVTGDNPSKHKGDKRPVTDISVSQLRGSCIEYDWPTSRSAAPNSFIGRIRVRSGLDGCELPTQAQWEYACRAGTTTKFYDGSETYDISRVIKLGRVAYNQRTRLYWEKASDLEKHKPDGKGGYMDFHTSVGMYKPNDWGLYDMYGNVCEWCVSRKYDTYGENPLGKTKGPKDRRSRCGGSWYAGWNLQTTTVQFYCPWERFDDVGFRLVLNVD